VAISTSKERIAILGIGLLANWLMVNGFNLLLYPFIIWKLGILNGGFVMTILSFLVCYATLLFYDWSKKDWLGIETIKDVKNYDGSKKVGKLTAWIMQKSDPVIFLFLSIKFDSFITTAYMRQGKYSGMGKREWAIFMGSLLISNIYWILACYMGISLFEWGWKAMAG
jgi:hypothetical protein